MGTRQDRRNEAMADSGLREYRQRHAREVANWIAQHAPPPPTGHALDAVATALGVMRFPREHDGHLSLRLAMMLTRGVPDDLAGEDR